MMIKIDMASGKVLSNTADNDVLASEETKFAPNSIMTRPQLMEHDYAQPATPTLPMDLVDVDAARFVARNAHYR